MGDAAKALGLITSVDIVYLAAAIIWGLGLWFLGVALMVSLHNYKRESIPFTLSWWAFIFPLGAYSMASLKIAAYFNSTPIYSYTILLTIGLAFLWSKTLILTVKGIYNGSLLNPHAN
jgi:Tellurite resistance protein and related permeases